MVTRVTHDLSETPDDRFTIGRAIRLTGQIAIDGPLCVDGNIEGGITSSDCVTILLGARVQATVDCAELVVSGCLIGNVSADRVVISSSGFVLGDICAPRVVIADGARFEGRIRDDDEPEDCEVTVAASETVLGHEVDPVVSHA